MYVDFEVPDGYFYDLADGEICGQTEYTTIKRDIDITGEDFAEYYIKQEKVSYSKFEDIENAFQYLIDNNLLNYDELEEDDDLRDFLREKYREEITQKYLEEER